MALLWNSVGFLIIWVDIIFTNLCQINMGCCPLLVVKSFKSLLVFLLAVSLIAFSKVMKWTFVCLFFVLIIQESTWLSRELAIKCSECWCPARVCFGKWNREWEAPQRIARPAGGCIHRTVSGVNDGNYTYEIRITQCEPFKRGTNGCAILPFFQLFNSSSLLSVWAPFPSLMWQLWRTLTVVFWHKTFHII